MSDRDPPTPGPPAPSLPAAPAAKPIRIGYACCSTTQQEPASRLTALEPVCERIFSEKISTRIKNRPELEKALKPAYDIKETAPDQEVILTVHELKRLSRNADARDIRDASEQALAESGIRLRRDSSMEREITPADLATDDWWETDVETAAEQSFVALIPQCDCCIEYTLGLDQQTWAAQLRNAALALTWSPLISRGF
ncbi:recombinase family protein [Kitasatospora griseola]|uniref:recombinase family protein n=1 Tax=Kitasatospora griseola TaxID=2064 RepID=UPI003855E4FD